MPRKGSNIYKRKDGRWEGRYSKGRDSSGKIVYGYVYAKTCAELKKRLRTMLLEPKKQKPVTLNLADVSEQWLSIAALKVKPSTFAVYDSIVRLHILPLIGKTNIGEINTALISTFVQDRLEHGCAISGRGLAPKTVRDILSVLKGIIDFAVEEKLIESPVSIIYPKQQQKPMRVLSNSEQAVLIQALLDNMTIHNAGILLCLYTGLRVGEVCALSVNDFFPCFDKVSVRQSVRRVKIYDSKTKLIIDSPKSKSSVRDIPLPQFLAPILMSFKREEAEYFISTHDSHLTEPRTMQNHFKRIIKTAGIADANFHCLRHTFATRCVEAGVDIKSLSEILGHSSVNITLNRYVHSSFEQKCASMNKLEQYLGL